MRIFRSNNIIVAVTSGDPGGIGPEVIVKSFADPMLMKHLDYKNGSNVFFVCFGAADIMRRAVEMAGVAVPLNIVPAFDESSLKADCLTVVDCAKSGENYDYARESTSNARLSLAAVETAAGLAHNGRVNALVTGPINKEACNLIKPGFTGHTEFLAGIDRAERFAMMLAGGPLRVVLVTTHVPLAQVSSRLTREKIEEKIELADRFLKRFVGIPRPRIGVAGLNPHAGEGGNIGHEEIDYIIPAIEAAKKKDIAVTGPYPADTIFHKAYHQGLDAVVAMYHDQGLGPLKMIAFESGINVTIGLSFIRTSCDHGTAFDIAWQNKANHASMREAIIQAVGMAKK